MSKIIRLWDRSRTVADWRCPRERYYRYEWGGRGIVAGNTSLELMLGILVHDGLAALANGIDIDYIAATQGAMMRSNLLDQEGNPGTPEDVIFACEQGALVEGLLRGFEKHMWPTFQRDYTIALIEQELELERDGMVFMSKPDLVLKHNETGELWYVEYKTTSSKQDKWVNQWSTAVQLHSTIRAIEAHLSEKVAGVIVQGLYKGYESYGKQSSPFCYAYRRYGNPPFTKTETKYEYSAGFKKFPSWELDGGVKEWVENMPEHVLTDQFPQSPPIYVKDDLIESFFTQRTLREKEIQFGLKCFESCEEEEAKKSVLEVFFPQKFDSCMPGWGRPCEYSRICHGEVSDPLRLGYELRQSHHAAEMEQHEKAEAEEERLGLSTGRAKGAGSGEEPQL